MATYQRRRPSLYSRGAKRRRIYKKTRYVFKRKARRFYRRRTSSVKRGYGFGDFKNVYCRWVAIENVGVGVDQSNVSKGTGILINSPYDPWSGIIGSYNVSAAGFDLYSRLYSRYIVLGAKLVCTFRSLTKGTADGDIPFKVGLFKCDASTINSAYNNWAMLATDPDTVCKTFVPSTKQKTSVTLTIKYSPRKEFNIKDPKDAAQCTGVGAATNSNPSRTIYVIPWLQSIYSATLNESQTWMVEYKLYQKVMFSDRNIMGILSHPDNLVQD